MTIQGFTKSANTTVTAIPAGPNAAPIVYDTVNLTVKTPKNITEIDDPGEGPNGNGIPWPVPPTAQQLQDYFYSVFTRQAAINVTVQPIVNVNVAWDGDLNGAMNHPGGAAGPAEYNAVINDPNIANAQADYKIVFVNGIVPIGNVVAGDTESIGFNVAGSPVVVAATRDVVNPAAPELPLAEKLLIPAHELGHAMGLVPPAVGNGGHNPLPDHLMTSSITRNANFLYELDKYEWDVLNP